MAKPLTTIRLRKLRPLTEVLKYRNPAVIEKFLASYAIPRRDAEALFTEMKRWLWLSARAHRIPDPPQVFVSVHLVAIDEMWHTFVLFTKDYAEFCDRYFGHFIHHLPTTNPRTQREKRRTRNVSVAAERPDWEGVIRLIVRELGEKTALRWYRTYPQRYSLAYLDKHRRTHQAIAARMV